MTIKKAIIEDCGEKYELYMVRDKSEVEFYASTYRGGCHYHVIGFDWSEFIDWCEGRPWEEVIQAYMTENDMFIDIIDQESALEGLHELEFLRQTNINFYGNLFDAISKYRLDPNGSPELKEALRLFEEYFL